MQKEVFESDIGESYVKAVHPWGLKYIFLKSRSIIRLMPYSAQNTARLIPALR